MKQKTKLLVVHPIPHIAMDTMKWVPNLQTLQLTTSSSHLYLRTCMHGGCMIYILSNHETPTKCISHKHDAFPIPPARPPNNTSTLFYSWLLMLSSSLSAILMCTIFKGTWCHFILLKNQTKEYHKKIKKSTPSYRSLPINLKTSTKNDSHRHSTNHMKFVPKQYAI